MIEDLISVLIFGTVDGSVYALLAMGFSLVYGVGGILNLAHGGFYLLTGYFVVWALTFTNLYVSMIIALILITIIGGVTYLGLIKPTQDNMMGVLLVTFALAFFFEQLVKVIWGTIHIGLPPLIPGNPSLTILGVTFSWQLFIIILSCILVVVLVMIFINKTKLGKSIRAVSQDREAAMLMGINANRVLMYTVMISAFLAGVAAILNFRYIAPFYGWSTLTKSFAVVIFGGLGSLLGSVIGAFTIGYITQITIYFFDESYAFLIPFIIIIIMLLVKPEGLFGKKEVS